VGITLIGTLSDGSLFSLDLTPGFDASNPLHDGFFPGSTLTVSAPAVASAITGDYNADGFVSQGDLDLVLLNWGDATAPAGFDEAALAGGGPFDSLMSQNELDGVLLNWGDGTPPTAVTPVPEPTSLVLLGLTALALRRRGS